MKNQVQFRSVANFVVNELDLAFAGPATWWTRFCHPWSLGQGTGALGGFTLPC